MPAPSPIRVYLLDLPPNLQDAVRGVLGRAFTVRCNGPLPRRGHGVVVTTLGPLRRHPPLPVPAVALHQDFRAAMNAGAADCVDPRDLAELADVVRIRAQRWSPPPLLELQGLGGPGIIWNGEPLTLPQRPCELLFHLAEYPEATNAQRQRDLWPDPVLVGNARNTMYTTIRRLRDALGMDAVVSCATGYRLGVPYTLDTTPWRLAPDTLGRQQIDCLLATTQTYLPTMSSEWVNELRADHILRREALVERALTLRQHDDPSSLPAFLRLERADLSYTY